uniref:G_PROTEIN_RECEP_F1_2 domain-containing protein n=1 Tax=Macrostomum lignano TaxID=282301 RepID=A0A1I8HAH6_9PLAT
MPVAMSQLPAGNWSDSPVVNITGCVSIRSCFPFPDAWGAGYQAGMLIGKLLTYYLIPGLLIALFYGKMAGYLIRSAGNRTDGTAAANAAATTSATAALEGRRKLAKLSLCLALVFFVAWGPDYLVMLHFFFWADRVSAQFLRFKMVA